MLRVGIRVRAAVNGIAGSKPGKGRISVKGLVMGQEESGKVALGAVVGPIARNLGRYRLSMEVIEKGKMWESDPDV